MWYAKCYMTRRRPWINVLLSSLSFLLAIGLMFHLSGRMQFIAYLAAYPAVYLFARGRLNWRHLAYVGVAGVLFILFGREIFWAVRMPGAIGERLSDVTAGPGKALADVLLEFSFPSLSLARVVELYSGGDGMRLFVDFPAALFNLVPKSLIEVQEMPTLTEQVGASLEAPVPADLVSLGFASAGVVGVIAIGAVFGALVAWLDRIFLHEVTALDVALKYGLMGIVALRVMYGDPSHLIAGHFGMVVVVVLYMLAGVPSRVVRLGGRQRSKRELVVDSIT
jgi:hypothetical protein